MSTRGMFARVQAGPEKTDDVPDEAAVRLVITHPKFRRTRGDTTSSEAAVWALAAAQGRGNAHRLNRNMIVFLAADARRYESLDEAVRHYLAWSDLAGSEQRITELDLPPQQATQARKRLVDADRTVDLRISDSYQWLLVPVPGSGGVGLAIDGHWADTAKERLAERAPDKLRAVDLLQVVQGPQNIRLDLDKYLASVWSRDGHIAVGQQWKYYCEYPYLPRLAERSVLGTRAASSACAASITGVSLPQENELLMVLIRKHHHAGAGQATASADDIAPGLAQPGPPVAQLAPTLEQAVRDLHAAGRSQRSIARDLSLGRRKVKQIIDREAA